MGLAMDGGRRFLAGRLHKAEHLPGPLVVPVAEVMNAMLVLDLEVFLVRATERLGLQSVDLVVHIEIERHSRPLFRESCWKCRQCVREGQATGIIVPYRKCRPLARTHPAQPSVRSRRSSDAGS